MVSGKTRSYHPQKIAIILIARKTDVEMIQSHFCLIEQFTEYVLKFDPTASMHSLPLPPNTENL